MSNVAVTSPAESSVLVSTPSTTSPMYPLLGLLDEPQQPRRLADGDHEHAGGVGIERAGVADLAFAETPAEHADDVVARDAGGLVDDRHPVRRRRLTAGHQSVVFDDVASRRSVRRSPISSRRS